MDCLRRKEKRFQKIKATDRCASLTAPVERKIQHAAARIAQWKKTTKEESEASGLQAAFVGQIPVGVVQTKTPGQKISKKELLEKRSNPHDTKPRGKQNLQWTESS